MPIRRIRSRCCARAASGHAVAPPSLFGLLRAALGQAERFFVALPMSEDLFTCAKDLLIEATAPTGLRDVA